MNYKGGRGNSIVSNSKGTYSVSSNPPLKKKIYEEKFRNGKNVCPLGELVQEHENHKHNKLCYPIVHRTQISRFNLGFTMTRRKKRRLRKMGFIFFSILQL